ncbi:MAG: response regulator transcription factor [Bacteroidota bacterium]
MNKKIPYKIMIVDDHQVFINGLAAILESKKEFNILETAKDGKEALDKLSSSELDLVITDISMPGMNGISFLGQAKEKFSDLKFIVLSMHNEVKIVKSILKLNPDAFLLKNTDAQELMKAIEAVMQGKSYYSEEIKDILVDHLRGVEHKDNLPLIPSLSQREKEVLNLITQEMTTTEIAEKLFLSLHTIETYRKNLLRKLEAKNSAGLVAKAYQLGLIEI